GNWRLHDPVGQRVESGNGGGHGIGRPVCARPVLPDGIRIAAQPGKCPVGIHGDLETITPAANSGWPSVHQNITTDRLNHPAAVLPTRGPFPAPDNPNLLPPET